MNKRGVSRSVPRAARACTPVYSSRRRRQSARRSPRFPDAADPPTSRPNDCGNDNIDNNDEDDHHDRDSDCVDSSDRDHGILRAKFVTTKYYTNMHT